MILYKNATSKRVSILFWICTSIVCICALSSSVYGSMDSILKRIDAEEKVPRQAQFKKDVTKNLNRFLNQYNAYEFIQRRWVSLGNLDQMVSPFWHTYFEVVIDAEKVKEMNAQAFYLPKYNYFFQERDLYLKKEPLKIKPILLWHEMIHAVSHRNVKDGVGPTFSYTEPVPKEKDHLYIEWAVSSAEGLESLAQFEDIMKQGGKNPSKQQLAKAHEAWRRFFDACQVSAYDENNVTVLPTEEQKGELERMMGFHVDPKKIADRYVGLGYPRSYFRAKATLVFWKSGKLDVTTYPGESVDITVRFFDPVGDRKYGWIDFEYFLGGVWAEIGKREDCPCEFFIKKTLTPPVTDPTRKRVFRIKVSYHGGPERWMEALPIEGKITVIPFERKLKLIVEDANTGKRVKNATVTLRRAHKLIDKPHKAPNGETQFDNLKHTKPDYQGTFEAPGYETRVVDSITLSPVRTRKEADTPKVIHIKMEEAGLQGLKIEPDKVHLKKLGATEKLKVFKVYKGGTPQPSTSGVSWKSDDPNIVAVNKSGIVRAIAAGITTIHATWGRRTAAVTVQVLEEIIVPNLVGKTEKEADNLLSPFNLKLSITNAPFSDANFPSGTIVSQNPISGTKVAAGTVVNVVVNPYPRPAIGIKILPEKKRSYPLNTKLIFQEDVIRKNTKKNTYTFKWYVDGKKISDKSSFTHTFTQSGSHYVMLDMFSSDPGENDTIRTNINIEYPDLKDMECGMTFDPPLNDDKKKYVEGDRISFIQSCKNIKKTVEFRWYVNDRYIGSGKKVPHTFNEQGTYKVKLGLRMGSNYDESNCTKSITIGSGIGVLGTERNRFKARGGLGNLSVCSEYWQGGYTPARWSPKCSEVSKIGPVDGYELCTGEQSDGWNTGFLVYSKKGSKKLNFQVYHFNFNKWKGFVHYSGEIPKAINPDPGSITLSCRANVADVRWTNEDRSTCSTKVWKFNYSSVLAHYGVEKPTCSKSSIDPKKLKRCKTFAKRAVEQFNENSNRKCNLQGPEWHGDEESHKQWCINVSQKEADDLTKHRDNALKKCGKTWCDSYAKRAVEQNEENIRNKCGFSGRRWQSGYNNHYDWCLNASKSAADSATRERDKKLQNCISGREGPCKRYAEKAVKQNEQNIRKDCGFCGQRWQSSFDNHFQWCLEQPQSARDAETQAREKLLNKCDVSSAGERTFYEPCYNGYRLDNCLNFGINCEKPAADKFCEEKGFTKATKWKLEKARPTYIIGDRSLCDDDFCAGFKYITCSGNKYPANNNPICTIKRPKSGIIIQPGKSVGFSADAKDPDRDTLTYAWVFEGGKPDKWESFQGSVYAVKWNNPGSYTATLTVTDNKGGTCTDTVAITVQDKDGPFDCDQYADKSVMQNEENLSNNCGFSGDLWHSGKSGHTNWCLNAGQSRAAQNIELREKALNECKGAAIIGTKNLVCEISTPAKIAFADAGKSVDFAGAAEGSVRGSLAYNWKFGEYGAEPGTSTKQKPGKVKFKYGGNYTTTLTVTDAGGQTCRDTRDVLVYDSNDPREFCEGYSGISIEQNQKNVGNGCGYSGEHWHNEELKHRKWCDSVSLDEARSGLTERDEKLRQCTGKKVPVKTDNKVTPPPISDGGAGTGSGTGGTKEQQPVSLAGNWVGNGHNVSISQNAQNVKATALENKGPVGWKIAAGEVKGNTVYMNFNGQNLTGNILSQGKIISWSNNATWTWVLSGSGSVGQSGEQGDLGKSWDVTEVYGWTGRWTRQGNSNVFDALWTLGGKQEKAVLTISINGNTVDVKRKQSAGYSYPGQECTYKGTLAADNVTVTGTYGCAWAAGPFNWQATIRRDSGEDGGTAQGTARLLTARSNQDMVGRNETYRGNGKYDAVFQAQFSAPNRTVSAVEVSNTNGLHSVWDTRSNNRLWLGAVVIGGRAMNRPDGSVNFSLGSGQTTLDYFVEDNGSIRGGKTNYRMTIFFASGDPLVMNIVPGGGGPGSSSSNTQTGTQHPPGDITKTTGTGPTGLTLDFETGRTNGWTKTGTAFDHQPTYGDNPTARHRGQPSKHVGNYWIGTFEKYQGSGSQTPGSVQGDGPIGTLTSNVFTIPTGSLSFLVGGGSSFQTRVELLVSGNRVLSVSGRGTETMHRVKWDLNPWAGQQGQIRLVDNASGGWGHINADDFRYAKLLSASKSSSGSPAKCGLGKSWDVTDAGWTGRWTRQGNSNVFDALWTLGGKQEKAVLTISINGNTVNVKRKQSAGYSYPGQECIYKGTLAADNVTVTGTYGCAWDAGPFNWRATIRCDSGGGSASTTGSLPPSQEIKKVITGYGKKK